MAAPLILLEAQPRRASDGAAVTVRLAGGGGELPYLYAGQHYRAGIVQLPTFITAIDFGGETSEAGEFGAGGVPQAAEIEWAPSSMELLAEIAGHYWADAPVSLYIGPETGAKPPLALAGKTLSGNVRGGVLTIAMSDPVADLKKPLLVERYGGAGDLDGPADWAGKIRRRIWGRVWNVAGDPLDPPNNIYCWADPLRPIQAIDAVRDRGAAAAALVLLGWQGSAIATLNALRAAVAPRGGGVVCPSIASVKWWTQPGDLTADLRGEIGAGYVETTAQIVERIIQAGANLPFAAGTIAAATAARPAPVGWIADDESTTQAAMIEELLGNSSLLWLLDSTGQIVLRPWAWGASVAAARSLDVRRTRTLKPVGTRQIGFRRNEHVMARSSLAGIVLAEDVVLEDGGSLDDAIAAGVLAKELAEDAQATADSKVQTFYQSSAPIGGSIGDLWFDTDDGNKLYRLDGTGWQVAQDASIGAAITAAAGAQATADGKVTTFYAAAAPVAEALGDLWYDLSTGYLRRWDGASWASISNIGATSAQVDQINQAIADAANAQALADGKVETFYQAAPPVDAALGDLWFDTDDGNKLYRHDGASWQVVQDASIGAAITAAAGAQATADGKVTTFYGSTAPVAPGVGDLWSNTGNSVLYRWSGSAWVEVAKIGADGAKGDQGDPGPKGDPGAKGDKGDPGPKGADAIAYVQEATPGAPSSTNQLWVKPSTKEMFRWNGSSWVKIQGNLAQYDTISSSALIGSAVILNAHIGNLQVDTLKIGNNAVTLSGSSVLSSNPTFNPDGNWSNLLSFSVNTGANAARIFIDAGAACAAITAQSYAQFRLRRGRDNAQIAFAMKFLSQFGDTVALFGNDEHTGSETYYFDVCNLTGFMTTPSNTMTVRAGAGLRVNALLK